MTVQAVATRFAGKALGDFLKLTSEVVSKPVESAVLNVMRGGGLSGPAASGPVRYGGGTVAKAAGTLAPAVLGYALKSGLDLIKGGESGGSGKTSFATSQYTPGRLPLTNEQAGEMLINQQRFNQQMQLIAARQAAESGAGSLGNSGISDIMALANRIYG